MRAVFLLSVLILTSTFLMAQGKIKGVVKDKLTGEPLPSADVHLLETKKGTISKKDGSFVIENINPGDYTIEVSYVGYKTFTKRVRVEDEVVEVVIELEQTVIHLPGVVVTGSPFEKNPFEIYQPVAILDEARLGVRLSDNVAKTLSFEPGINAEYTGSIAGRPVVRGLSGSRVSILDNGVKIGDVSEYAEIHAVAFDPLSVERIEVLKGPASLFYGGNSIGGAINLITNEIPQKIHHELRGSVKISGSNLNDAGSGTSVFEYGIGNLGLRAEFGIRKTGNIKVPGEALPNSDAFNRFGSFGMRFFNSSFNVGIGLKGFVSEYGIPREENIRFKSNRFRSSIQGEYTIKRLFFSNMQFDFNYTDHKFKEIEKETGEVGTQHLVKNFNFDVRFKHKEVKMLNGLLGLSFGFQRFKTLGEEKTFADANMLTGSIAFYEEIKFEKLNFQVGGRFDIASVKTDEFRESERVDRNFSVLSGAFGAIYKIAEPLNIAINFSRGYRLPTLEELFAWGKHAGTGLFEVGDPNLKSELANEIDVSAKYLSEKLVFEISGFYNFIDNYIYPREDDDTLKYLSTNARLRGWEVKTQFEVLKNVGVSLVSDFVEGIDRTSGDYLPWMPPLRGIISVEYRTNRFNFGGEVKLVAGQKRVAPGEEFTPHYEVVNLFFGLRIPYRGLAHELNLRVENLFNKSYIDHLARPRVPMPARNVTLVYHLFF